MVSKAREDFPEPETPVKTINSPCLSFRDTFFKLCTATPLRSIIAREYNE
jgi:hypothetical protein